MLIAIVNVAAFLQHSTINRIASLFLANSTSLYKMYSNSLVYFQFQLRNLSLLYNCTEVKIIGMVSFFRQYEQNKLQSNTVNFWRENTNIGKISIWNFFDLFFLLCKKSNETFFVTFKLSEMPSAKDVKFAISPF